MSSEPRRLHPAELAFGALDALRELLFPVLLGVVIGSGSGSGRALLIGVAGLAAGGSLALVRWWRTTYAVTAADVHFRSGIASPDETVVPIARIAAVDVVQGPLQRLLGVVELQVQVAGGGGEPEIRLRAVARDDALALRAALGHPAAPPAPPLWRLSRRRLLVAALTAPQLGLLVPVLALAGAVGQQLVEAGEGPRLADRLPGTAGGAALAAAALLAAAWALSVAGAVVAFAGFELRVEGDRLRIRRGLLQRRAASVPLDRVHAVRLLESPVRQPFGLVAVRLETAGYRSQARATQTLLPVAGHDEARAVLARVLAVPPAATALRAVPARARRRYALWPALGGAAAGAGVVAVAGAPALLPLVPALAAAGAAAGLLRHADAGWALDGDRVTVRARRVGRVTLVARRRRLQSHELRQTPLQRRARLAHLSLTVGSGARGRVRHLDADVARGLFADLRPAPVRARVPAG